MVAVALPLLAACAPPPPVDLTEPFSPPSAWRSTFKGDAAHPLCAVRLAALNDLRADPHAVGNIGLRMIHAADVPVWIRSGIDSVARYSHIQFGQDGALSLDVDIVKVYVLSQTMDKAANVVLRVRYSRGGGAPEEIVYRGADNATNWNSTTGETQSALDRALAQALEAMAHDILTRCAAP